MSVSARSRWRSFLSGRPALLVVAGAGCLSVSAMLVKLAGTNATTAAFLRCAIALGALIPLGIVEWRRRGQMPWKLQGYAVIAGVFLGIDYALWTQSILDVGAAISTVLINVQVVVFPLLAWIFSRTAIARRFLFATPIMLVGIVLASGALGYSAQVEYPVRGTLLGITAGIAYAIYLYLTRLCGQHSPRHMITPVSVATIAATVTTGIVGVLTTGITLTLSPASWGWLVVLALLGQVAAWLLLSAGTPKLAPNTSAALLLLQPVLAIVFGLIILHETPTTTQLLGCVVVIAAVWFANRRRLKGQASRRSPSPSRSVKK